MFASCSYTGFVVKEVVIPSEEGGITAFFCPKDECTQVVIDFIGTGENVHCAFYDLTHEDVIDILKRKGAYVVVDEDEYEGLGVPVNAKGIMHNKFCVVNDSVVLTGSFNPTSSGGGHRNNIVIIESRFLSQNYLDEFSELKNNVPQHQKKIVPNPVINLSGRLIENYFCPEDGCEAQVLSELKNAEESVYFMTYSFTSDPIGNLLVEKDFMDVEVKGIFEKQQISKWSEYHKLKEAGIDVFIDEQKYLMHNKVFIIDEKVVITGSYNPSKNANENNDENIVIIHDEEIAGMFVDEFERQWSETFINKQSE